MNRLPLLPLAATLDFDSSLLRHTRIAFAVLVVALSLATPARAEPGKCRAAITDSSAALVQATLKALKQCEEGKLKGKTLGPCPDQKAGNAIAKAETKLHIAITKACCGKDALCTGAGDDDPLAAIGWDIGTCPNLEGGTCNNTITTAADVATCVACVGELAADQAINLYYGTFLPSEPKGTKQEKALNKCQVTIGKAAADFFVAKSKVLKTCWDKVNKGNAPGPCPDQTKAEPAIVRASAKKDTAIANACCGKNKICDASDTGANTDIALADLGFGSVCEAPCGGYITDMRSLIDCVDCVTAFKADCADWVAVPRMGSIGVAYPTQCNHPIAPSPTPTVTGAPAPTATATATSTSTATATRTPTPTATATPPRFIDNGDGTVSDTQTGLQWEKKTTAVDSGENYTDPHDVDNTYSWCLDADQDGRCENYPDPPPDGTAFTDFLVQLNTAPCFAGHCDWRLPVDEEHIAVAGVNELSSIVSLPLCAPPFLLPCIDPVFGPTPTSLSPNSTEGYIFYWSATAESPPVADLAWAVDFRGLGSYSYAIGKQNFVYVRAVRTGP